MSSSLGERPELWARSPRWVGGERSAATLAILGAMAVRYKLAGAPLAYTLAIVEGTGDPYKSFGTALWSDDQNVAATLKELIFMRTSIVNQCPT